MKVAMVLGAGTASGRMIVIIRIHVHMGVSAGNRILCSGNFACMLVELHFYVASLHFVRRNPLHITVMVHVVPVVTLHVVSGLG